MNQKLTALRKQLKRKLSKRQTTRNKTVLSIIAFVLVILIATGFTILNLPVNTENARKVVTIPKGTNLSGIANLLAEKQIIDYPRGFIIAVKMKHRSKSLRAGRYRFAENRTYLNLIETLSDKKIHTIRITIPEGYQARNIAALLNRRIGLDSLEFMQKVNDPAFMKDMNIHAPSLEGYLFPDTYDFSNSEIADDILFTLVERFNDVVDDTLLKAIKRSGRSLHDVLKMASIVEGECKTDEERPIVASVYYNRLRRGMKLESDPTVQYIIPDGPRRLYKNDLDIDSPYNTYRYKGLPKGPVNNPGRKSIYAAIFPARTKYIYMVANGDGTHTFTTDYQSFLYAKQRLQRIRKQVEFESAKGKKN